MPDETKTRFGLSGSLFSAGGVIVILLTLVFINLIFSQLNVRWDATADDLYSLSDGTREILSDLERDVTIKFFYSRDNVNLPVHIKTYAKRMLDFLREYEYASDGRVTVEVYSPKPDSEEEEWAQKYGIEPINLPTGERAYFGLVALSADQEEAIPSIDPTREAHLEYDITRLIHRVQSADQPRLGVISSLPVFGGPPPGLMRQQAAGSEPWVFLSELEKTYQVEQIPVSAETIEPEIDLLLLLYPRDMTPTLAYAVDQFILKGGDAILFADPMCVSDGSQSPAKSAIPETLFSAWGIKIDPAKVLVDFDYATRLRNQNNQVENNPLWLSVGERAFNADDVTTAPLESMLFPVAGAIEKTDTGNLTYTPLIQSSQQSAMTEAFRIRFGVNQIRRDFKASADRYDLAVRLQGTFKTAFPAGKPEPEDSESEPSEASDEASETAEAGLTEGTAPATVIVVADADLLFDAYYVSRQNFLGFNIARIFNDNLNFLLNSCEVLTGSDALIGIRSRGKFERPFTKVETLERRAQERWLAREQELVAKVEETNRKLRQLEGQKDDSQQLIISDEQERAIEKFEAEKRRINEELKLVRRKLREDIETLGTQVKAVNIFVMPMIVALAGVGYGLYRRRKSTQS